MQRVEKKTMAEPEKQTRVTCYNCAQWGHYSTDYKKAKQCFVCQTAAHVGKECPE
jgi:hypothetical protein